MKNYKHIVQKIVKLSWSKLTSRDLQNLMYLAYISAQEFAESLRSAIELYPDSKNLQMMALGELKTDNLSYEEYDNVGDHAEFLGYFIKKYSIKPDKFVSLAGEFYIGECSKLPQVLRAMSVFSREEELPNIFGEILSAPDWTAPGLQAFKYYLEKHISLDTEEESGHSDLVKKFILDERLAQFYEIRLNMYRCIPALFV